MPEAQRALGGRAVTASDAVAGVATLVRFSALGGSMILPLVGVASAAGGSSLPTVVFGAAVGAGFHVFAYVLNDVVDLPIDRTDPRRARSPLVAGVVGTPAALALAIAMLVVAMLAAAQAGIAAVAALGAAALGLAAYDLLGKRTRWPLLADVVQAIGWASLVLAGAWLAGSPTPLSLALAAYVIGFIVLANGVHGALRDLENDTSHGLVTTAAMLGATATPDGRRHLPRRVMAYALALQLALLAVTGAAILVANGSATALVPSIAAVLLLAAAARARTDADLLAAGMLHLIVALTVPIALVAGGSQPLVTLLVAIYIVPLLSHGWLPGALGWGRRAAAQAGRYAADLLVLTRPHNSLAAGLAVVAGAHLGGRADLVAEPVLRAALVAALVVAATNVANDLADVTEDRVNRPARPLAAGRVSRRAAAVLTAALGSGALLLAATLGPTPAAVAVLFAAAGLAYSRHLKGAPLVGHLVVASLSAGTLGFGALALARPTTAVAIGLTFVFVSVLSSELLKGTADRDGDRVAGRATLATRLSVERCLLLHRALVVALLVLVLAPSVVGTAAPAFLVASFVGLVLPQLAVLVRLRGVTHPAEIRTVLPLTKLTWFTGLAALLFLV